MYSSAVNRIWPSEADPDYLDQPLSTTNKSPNGETSRWSAPISLFRSISPTNAKEEKADEEAQEEETTTTTTTTDSTSNSTMQEGESEQGDQKQEQDEERGNDDNDDDEGEEEGSAFYQRKWPSIYQFLSSYAADGDHDAEKKEESTTTTTTTTTTSSDTEAPVRRYVNPWKDPMGIIPSDHRAPLKVMFLSANAGGGHRASAASLTRQFELHFPGSECKAFELEELAQTFPYSQIAKSYKELTTNRNLWRMIYHVSNTRTFEKVMDYHTMKAMSDVFTALLKDYNPDVVVSVHPNMNLVPCAVARKIGHEEGRHIPFFTVVTDLGSGHCGWFQKDVDRLYLASDKIRDVALTRGRTPEERILLTGLPIRHDFAVIAEKMGDRLSPEGRAYRASVKDELDLPIKKPMLLVMGGGEGVGSLTQIVTELYITLKKSTVDCTICVVCAKNAELKKGFEETDWEKIYERRQMGRVSSRLSAVAEKLPTAVTEKLPSLNLFYSKDAAAAKAESETKDLADVTGKEEGKRTPETTDITVVPLGFVTRMAEYMAAAEILITKAGPGTIAEAASLGLPIMLTSYLPGQEHGNIDVVLEQGFGSYCEDPVEIASTMATWLKLPSFLDWMSRKASKAGHPTAAAEIVLDIGSRTHAWIDLVKQTQAKKKQASAGDSTSASTTSPGESETEQATPEAPSNEESPEPELPSEEPKAADEPKVDEAPEEDVEEAATESEESPVVPATATATPVVVESSQS